MGGKQRSADGRFEDKLGPQRGNRNKTLHPFLQGTKLPRETVIYCVFRRAQGCPIFGQVGQYISISLGRRWKNPSLVFSVRNPKIVISEFLHLQSHNAIENGGASCPIRESLMFQPFPRIPVAVRHESIIRASPQAFWTQKPTAGDTPLSP